MESGSGWGVVQTYYGNERKAVENLHRQNFEAFCPLAALRSRSKLIGTVESPLFPCYVFVLIAPQQRWSCINSTYGVIRLLTDLNTYAPRPLFVPDSKINEILALSNTVADPLPIGTVVRVRNRNNPFFDTVGTVVGMDKTMRISVMMNIFNRDVVVEFVNPNDLEESLEV